MNKLDGLKIREANLLYWGEKEIRAVDITGILNAVRDEIELAYYEEEE